MATSRRTSFAPRGWHTVTPRLVVSDAKALVRFLKKVFAATGSYEAQRPSQIRIGDSIVMITDVGARAVSTALLYVYVKDTDAAYRRALRAGARSIEEPRLTEYGDRRCIVEDEWGNTWQIATFGKRTHRSKA